jgi:hypothetical protein
MSTKDLEVADWNRQAAEFLLLSPCDQEVFNAALNAGGDPDILLDALLNEGVLAAVLASGADCSQLFLMLPPEVVDLAAEVALGCISGL